MAYNAEAAFMAKDIFDAEKMVARQTFVIRLPSGSVRALIIDVR